MPLPTDPIGLAIYLISFAIEASALPAAYERMRTGISAKAQAEGRDVTDEEEAILDALLAASEKARDGK